MASATVVWVPDDQVSECTKCKTPFTFFNRRHHCRNCGNIFCGACSSRSIPLPKFGKKEPQRVCDACYDLETRRGVFEKMHLPLLLTGDWFTKHAHGVGAPQNRFVVLSADYSHLEWREAVNAPAKGMVPICDLLEVKEGQQTPAFRRTGKSTTESVSFSLVFRKRTLDLEASSPAVKDRWVAACREIPTFLPELRQQRLAELKEKEAERRKKEEAERQRKAAEAARQERLQKREEVRAKYGLRSAAANGS